MLLTFLTLLQSQSSTPAVDTPRGGHFLPIYEFPDKPKPQRKKLRGRKAKERAKPVVHQVTAEQLQKIAEAIAPKVTDKNREELSRAIRQAVHEEQIFSELKALSDYIMADMLLMAHVEHLVSEIKREMLKKVVEEQEGELEQLMMKLIVEDII